MSQRGKADDYWIGAARLMLLAFFVYANSFDVPFVLDSETLMLQNSTLDPSDHQCTLEPPGLAGKRLGVLRKNFVRAIRYEIPEVLSCT